MTEKFHINSDTGEIKPCQATKRPCRFAQEAHYNSLREAETLLEQQYSSSTTFSKEKKFNLPIDPDVQKAITVLDKVGTPYIVGGAVRDAYRGTENKDIDIEVHNTDLDTLISTLRKNQYHVDEVGKSFGVLKVSKGSMIDLDISVPRRENRVGAGHRDFEVDLSPMTVQEAAERRDFTFNAIMYDPVQEKLVDPSGGSKDLKNGVMKHVSEKFKEDPLRVLRGFQFGSRFSMHYDSETSKMCKSIRSEYGSLASERVSEEWDKFYTKGINAKAGIKTLQDSGWDDTEPGLQNALKDKITIDSLQRLPKADKDKRSVLGIAATIQSMNTEDAQNFARKISVSQKESKIAQNLVSASHEDLSTPYSRRWYARNHKNFTFDLGSDYAKLTQNSSFIDATAKAKNEGLGTGPEKDLVTGDEIMNVTGRKPGPWMSDAVNKLRDLQYSRKASTKEELLNKAKELFTLKD